MQEVRCVRATGQFTPGDLSEVPDGAAVNPDFWEFTAGAATQAAETPAAPPADGDTPGPAETLSDPPSPAKEGA